MRERGGVETAETCDWSIAWDQTDAGCHIVFISTNGSIHHGL